MWKIMQDGGQNQKKFCEKEELDPLSEWAKIIISILKSRIRQV
jgi:hypothetical protein